jgi:hypothetical protein
LFGIHFSKSVIDKRSSNPKADKNKINKNSKTGWNWYKDFQQKKTMKSLHQLVEFIFENPSKQKTERTSDIKILAKSSPPNITKQYVIEIIDKFYA